MIDFFPEIEVTQPAAEAIARGLFAIAEVDGLHEREEALVASFWSDVGGSVSALAELKRGTTITSAELSAALPNPELRQLFVKTAILLAWADGKVTDPERKAITDFATPLGVAGAEFGNLETAVKEFLLGHLTTVTNSEAVAKVAKKLNL